MTRILQFIDARGACRVGLVVDATSVAPLDGVASVYALAQDSIRQGSSLEDAIGAAAKSEVCAYQDLVDERRLLAPLHHPDPAHFLVTGTGLTHLGSATTRAAMHQKLAGEESELTDSMRMFRLGLEGGKPAGSKPGVQPEWFYKGDGGIVVAPEQAIEVPGFSLDIGDEAEIVGLYIVGEDGSPYRIGFALGNEYSDHKTEKLNYLYLAHSKLRPCAFGPEIALGELPANIVGSSRIRRKDAIVWEREFLSGEENMSHSIANLEYHHFKYAAFRRPGDLHAHYFGTGTLSFADGFAAAPGDVFELESEHFGRALRNEYRLAQDAPASNPVNAL
jgi:hypothetical protein